MRGAVLLAMLAAPAWAQDSPVFDPAPILACLPDGGEDCIGLASSACMETGGGSTTVGMGFCLDAERRFWDDRLNGSYRQVMAQAKAADADPAEPGLVPRQVPALRDMQRHWIAYRDAACAYEATRWGGGTGAGPAATACAMQLTARQALRLDGYLREGP